MDTAENVTGLAEEYRALFEDADTSSPDSVEIALIRGGEWTSEAAVHLLRLARENGVFMLRNALGISLALEIEDGKLGF